MKKIILGLFITLFIIGTAFAASDAFFKRLQICNPYESQYYNPAKKQNLKRGILGVTTEVNSMKQYCVYYIQKSNTEYDICEIPVTALNQGMTLEENSKCKTSDFSSIKETKKNLGNNSYVLRNYIIESTAGTQINMRKN